MESNQQASGLERKRHPYADMLGIIGSHLEGANEELLGLHRYGVLTYEQYTDVANLLVDARQKLKEHINGETPVSENLQGEEGDREP